MRGVLDRLFPLRALALAVFLAVTYMPLAGALAGAWSESGGGPGDLVSARRVELLARSLSFSFLIAVLTQLLGLLAALAILRRLPRATASLQWVLLASVALPPTVYALAWSPVFGALSARLGMSLVGHTVAAGVAQGLALLPLATGIALLALRTADRLLIDAAQVLVPPARLLFAVAVPLARPTLFAGAALVFLLSLLDYTIPSIFGVNLYALEVFVVFSATHQVSDALWLSAPLILCALTLVGVLAGLPRQLAQAANPAFPHEGRLPYPLAVATSFAAFLALIALLAPFIAILPALGNPAYLARTVASSIDESAYTFATSAASASIALLLALAPAIEMVRGRRYGRLLWGVCLLPFLLPPALTGIGLIAAWRDIRLIDVYGSSAMTVAAELARFAPVCVAVLATAFLRIDPGLIDAALVTGASLRRIAAGVLIPLALPGLVTAIGLAFVLSLGEIGANLLVTPAGAATLTMKTYNYLHYGGSQAAAGQCLLLVALAILGATLPALAARHWGRFRDLPQ